MRKAGTINHLQTIDEKFSCLKKTQLGVIQKKLNASSPPNLLLCSVSPPWLLRYLNLVSRLITSLSPYICNSDQGLCVLWITFLSLSPHLQSL